MSSYRLTHVALLFCLLPVFCTFSQPDYRYLNQTGYSHVGADFWASGGAGIAERGIPGAAFANPALLSFASPTATVEFGWRPTTDYWYSTMKYDYDNTFALPSYASVGVPSGSYSFEAGYARTYDERSLFPRAQYIAFTSIAVGPPIATGQYFDVTYTSVVHTAFAAASYTLQQNFSVGVTVALDYIRYESAAINSEVQSGTRVRFALGGVARPWESVSIAVCGIIVPKDYRGYPSVTLPITAESNSGPEVWLTQSPSFNRQSPSDVNVGTSVHATSWLTFMGSVEYQMWSTVGLGDQWQFHAGGVASVLPMLKMRAGFFTQSSTGPGAPEYFDQDFLTVGLAWRMTENLTASCTYLTSAPFTKDLPSTPFSSGTKSLSQKMLSGGVSYSW